MSKGDKGWLARRGQTTADTAIDELVELRPNERIQQISDNHIDDSPAQVREAFSEHTLEDLVESMQQSGFTGVLVVRPHPDSAGRYQLLFGHRRRAAWRIVCRRQGRECFVPVIARPITDRDMLIQGAQENLARQDLSLFEECNLVARLLKEFYPTGQEEIARMIGKTRGWIAPRARVNALPAELRERLWQRPGAMSHFLELAMLYRSNASVALILADRIVRDELTLSTVHDLVKEHEQENSNMTNVREDSHNRTGNSSIVPSGTIPAGGTLPERTLVREHERVKPRHVEDSSIIDDTGRDYIVEMDQEPDINGGQVEVVNILHFRDHAQDHRLAHSNTPLNNKDKEQLRQIMQMLLQASETAARFHGAERLDQARAAIDYALEVVRQVMYDPS